MEWIEAIGGSFILLGLLVYMWCAHGLHGNVQVWEMGIFILAFIFIIHSRTSHS
jgi:hypothetical protein